MKKYIFVIITIICLQASISFAQPSTPEFYSAQAFDIEKYILQIDLSKYPQTETNGKVKIFFNWLNKNMNSEFFFHAKGIKPDSVIYHNKKIDFQLIDSIKNFPFYSFKRSYFATQTDTVDIYYSGTMINEGGTYPWGGINYDDKIMYNMGVGMMNPEVSAARYWFPCYDHPSDKAKFSGRFIVPAGKILASIGNLKNIEYLDNGCDIYEWETDFPVATYLVSFALGDFKAQKINCREGLDAYIYSKSEDTTKVKKVFQNISKIVEICEDLFGTYPFEKVGYVITLKGSMEHQTMIDYAKSVFNEAYSKNDTYDATLIHELVHQWFGNSVSVKDYRDAWLSESFAEFGECYSVEKSKSLSEYYKKVLSESYSYVYSTATSEKKNPLYAYNRTQIGNYPRTIYNKGASVLAILRQELGSEVFDPMLKDYFQKYKNSNLNTKEFIDFVTDYTKKDMTTFFRQWVYSREYPVITVNIHKEYNPEINAEIATKVEISQVQADTIIFKNLPVEITIENKDGSKKTLVQYISDKNFVFDISEYKLPIKSFVVNSGENSVSLLRCMSQKIVSIKETVEMRPMLISPNIIEKNENISLVINSEKEVSAELIIVNSVGDICSDEKIYLTNGDSKILLKTNNLTCGKYKIILKGAGFSSNSDFIIH